MTQFVFVGASGQSLYTVLLNEAGQWWSNALVSYEDYSPGHLPAYSVSLTEVGLSGVYVATLPSAFPSGATVAVYRRRLGSVPSESDLNVGAEAFLVGASVLDTVASEVGEMLTQVVGVAT